MNMKEKYKKLRQEAIQKGQEAIQNGQETIKKDKKKNMNRHFWLNWKEDCDKNERELAKKIFENVKEELDLEYSFHSTDKIIKTIFDEINLWGCYQADLGYLSQLCQNEGIEIECLSHGGGKYEFSLDLRTEEEIEEDRENEAKNNTIELFLDTLKKAQNYLEYFIQMGIQMDFMHEYIKVNKIINRNYLYQLCDLLDICIFTKIFESYLLVIRRESIDKAISLGILDSEEPKDISLEHSEEIKETQKKAFEDIKTVYEIEKNTMRLIDEILKIAYKQLKEIEQLENQEQLENIVIFKYDNCDYKNLCQIFKMLNIDVKNETPDHCLVVSVKKESLDMANSLGLLLDSEESKDINLESLLDSKCKQKSKQM